MKKFSVFIVMLIFSGNALYGQDVRFPPAVISAGGSNFYNTLSPVFLTRWRIGEINVLTLPSMKDDLKVATIPDVQEELSTDWSVAVYPNPVRDYLKIRFNSDVRREYRLELTDVTGRQLYAKKTGFVYAGEVVDIDLTGYLTGMYLLRIVPADESGIRLFKITKNTEN